MRGIGHWDWFGGNHGIQPCDSSAERSECPVGWLTAAELILGFMTKRLLNWNAPQIHQNTVGDTTFGDWTSSFDPW